MSTADFSFTVKSCAKFQNKFTKSSLGFTKISWFSVGRGGGFGFWKFKQSLRFRILYSTIYLMLTLQRVCDLIGPFPSTTKATPLKVPTFSALTIKSGATVSKIFFLGFMNG